MIEVPVTCEVCGGFIIAPTVWMCVIPPRMCSCNSCPNCNHNNSHKPWTTEPTKPIWTTEGTA